MSNGSADTWPKADRRRAERAKSSAKLRTARALVAPILEREVPTIRPLEPDADTLRPEVGDTGGVVAAERLLARLKDR